MSSQTLAEAITDGRGVERPCLCPVHDDTNASASVNVLKGLWVCYTCGAAGTVDGFDTVPDAEALLRLMRGAEPMRTLPEAWLDLFDAYEPSRYWSARFGEAIATRYRCGTHPQTGLPTYPIRDAAGRVLGVVVRNEHDKPKYRYPFGVSTSRTFFGDLTPNPVVVLVEGAADVMALAQSGIPANWTVLGCYGAGIHAPQASLLRDLAPIVTVLAFDDDDAGRAAMQRTEASLNDVTPCVSYPWGSIGATDPGDADVQHRITGLQDALSTTPYRRFAA